MHWLMQRIRTTLQGLKNRLLKITTIQAFYERCYNLITGLYIIPKELHFIWLGSRVPDKYKNNLLTWLQQNPDYNVNLYIDSAALPIATCTEDLLDMKNFCKANRIALHDVAKIPEFQEFVQLPWYNDWLIGEDKVFAYAADTLRLEIIYRFGGVYSDIDMICEAPLGDLSNTYGFVGWKYNTAAKQEFIDDNCFFAARVAHPILAICREEIALHYQKFIICGANYMDVLQGKDIVHSRLNTEHLTTISDPIAQRSIMNAAYDNYRLTDASTIYYKNRFVGTHVSIIALNQAFSNLYKKVQSDSDVFLMRDKLKHQQHRSWALNLNNKRLKGVLGVTLEGNLSHINNPECITYDEVIKNNKQLFNGKALCL